MNDPKLDERTAKIPTDSRGDAATAAIRRELTDDETSGVIGGLAPGPQGGRTTPPYQPGPFREPIVWKY